MGVGGKGYAAPPSKIIGGGGLDNAIEMDH